MTIDYFLNWMGPINQDWIAEHGDQWSSGRIDINGIPGEPFGREHGVAPILTEDWWQFGEFLDDFVTDRIYSLEELVEAYEKASGRKITWLQK